MRAMKVQYFLSYGVLGSWVPVISLYFREQGLSLPQIGTIYAAAGVALALTPVFMTLLADTKMDARHVLSLLLLSSGLTMLGAWGVGGLGYWPTLVTWVLHNVCFAAVFPLQDGVNFAIQRRRQERGEPVEAYHKVRVWGTVGYIVPSAFLYLLLRAGYGVGVLFAVGAAFGFVSAVTALRLPKPGARTNGSSSKLPTLEAARVLMRPPLRIFCVAMFLATLASTVFYVFYPLYLKGRIGIDDRWMGPISSIGVVVEIFFVLGFGYLLERIGLKRLMLLGIGAMALRFTLLWGVANAWVAVGTQALHGLMVLVIVIAPPVFLNRHAGEGYRNSMQGVYALAVVGVGRVLGNYLAGKIAARFTESGVFAWSAILCLIAAVLIAVAFYEEEHEAAEGELLAEAKA